MGIVSYVEVETYMPLIIYIFNLIVQKNMSIVIYKNEALFFKKERKKKV